MDEQKEPRIDHNSTLQSYYGSLESRIGYRLFLGDTRHFGYYEADRIWPFPITAALRKMEERLFKALDLQPGAKVLDAGCGAGRVAAYMASKGLHVYAIDIVKEHVRLAQQYVKGRGLEKSITVRWMDYHHLEELPDESFDGIYTMETLVHASDPEKVLGEFFRLLKPGGSLAHHEYEHPKLDDILRNVPNGLMERLDLINRRASMPACGVFEYGVLPSMLKNRGFQDIQEDDYTDNLKPLLMFFYYIAYIPFLFIRLMGLEALFVNTDTGVQFYSVLKWRLWRYAAISARKPRKVS